MRYFQIWVGVYLQSVSDFIGDIDPSAGRFGVVGNNTSAGHFGKRKVSLLFVPLAQELINVELCHGKIIRTPAQIWDLGFNHRHHQRQYETHVLLHSDRLTRYAHGRLTFIGTHVTAMRSPTLETSSGHDSRSTTKPFKFPHKFFFFNYYLV